MSEEFAIIKREYKGRQLCGAMYCDERQSPECQTVFTPELNLDFPDHVVLPKAVLDEAIGLLRNSKHLATMATDGWSKQSFFTQSGYDLYADNFRAIRDFIHAVTLPPFQKRR